MKALLLTCCFFVTGLIYAQTNLSLVGALPYESEVSDIWGYVDTEGNEYALVGVNSGGTSVVSLENPAMPVEVYFAPGAKTIWRDIKTWQGFSYTVNDKGHGGIQILDLRSLPDASGIVEYQFLDSVWTTAHNIYIDERGYAYIFGANRDNGGVIIYDLATPEEPVEIGKFEDFYVHDGYVKNNTLYLANILEGFFSVVDVTDPANPQLITTNQTPRNFTHNVWTSDDQNYLYSTDERSGAWLAAYDISDLNNVFETDRIRTQHSGGLPVIIHNTFYLNDYLITSYYRDGVTVHDATRPHNLIEVGHYDTSPLEGGGFNGCWGVYPYLPSGLILASDIEEGLFVLQPNYIKGAYLEGIVTDDVTGLPLKEVEVYINELTKEELSEADGSYGTGTMASGQFQVTYSKPGYFPKTETVSLTNGVVTWLNVALTRDPSVTIAGKITFNNGLPYSNGEVYIKGPLFDTILNLNSLGEFELKEVVAGNYSLQLHEWGFYTECYSDSITDFNNPYILLEAQRGFVDNFSSDLGWEVSSTINDGEWERDMPEAVESGEPLFDDPQDCFNKAYFTKNGRISNGQTMLSSPSFNGAGLVEPELSFSTYWWNGGVLPNDQMLVMVSNGSETVELMQVSNFNTSENEWNNFSFKLSDFITLTESMQVSFIAEESGAIFAHQVEVAVDNVEIKPASNTGLNQLTENQVNVFPNPASESISITGYKLNTPYVITDVSGKRLKMGVLTNNKISVSDFKPGVYFITIENQNKKLIVE